MSSHHSGMQLGGLLSLELLNFLIIKQLVL